MRNGGWRARALLLAVVGGGPALVAFALVFIWQPSQPSLPQYVAFAALTVAACGSQMLGVAVDGVGSLRRSFSLTLVFVFAGIMVLEYWQLAALLFVAFIPESVRWRRPVRVHAYNTGNFLIAATCARAAFDVLSAEPGSGWYVLGMLAGGFGFVVVNTGLNLMLIALVRGMIMRDAVVISLQSLMIDTGLAVTGAMLAIVWQTNPWFSVIAVYPLVLVHRSLLVPSLRKAVALDSKTGLANAGYFYQALGREFRRCSRAGRQLTLIMADLDDLRGINNRYGHLAGDAVIGGVAEVITRQVRAYDMPARFGGEEFAVILPDTDLSEGLVVAERIRAAVEATRFDVSLLETPVRATISIGVACYPQHADSETSLVHEADLALLEAKSRGRNRVIAAVEGSS